MIDLDVNVTQQSALNTKLSILYTIYRGGGTRDELGAFHQWEINHSGGAEMKT